MTFVPSDIQERERATKSLKDNVLVLAGAGTGKTHLLIDRLSLLLLQEGIPVERIVALTFTKKAGEEMRERLEERLRHTIDNGEPLLKERAQKALDDIPKAQIGTIHSFAAHLLRLYPLQAQVDPSFREDEGTLFDQIFEQEWRDWIAVELGESSPRTAFWMSLLPHVALADLKNLAKQLASPHVEESPKSNSESLANVVQNLKRQWEIIKNGNEFPTPQKAPTFHEAIRALESAFQHVEKGKSFPKDMKEALRGFQSPPKSLGHLHSDLKNIRQRMLSLAMVDETLLTQAQQAVRPFVELLRKELRRRGVVSFDGLLVFARNLVRDHPEVRNALKNRFDTFLVDEFQDTDPVQGEILFYLCEQKGQNAKHWREVQLAPGRLFVVGDPKQSIYRFRGADIAAFQAFQEHMIKNGALQTTLSNNFRSVPGVLDFVNHVFPLVMKPEPFLQSPYDPLTASRENPTPPEAPVECVVATGETSSINADEGRWLEADHVGRWIEKHKTSGGLYSDIAILLRSSNAFFPYLEALRQRNIPYLVEGEKSFYLTSEILDFFNLVSAVADSNDALALVGVLRSPLAGLTDKHIFDLKQNHSLDYQRTPRVHKNLVQPTYELLKRFSDLALTQSVPVVVHQLLQESGLLELTMVSSYGEQALANLQKISFLAQKWNDETPLTMTSFARRLRQYQDEERKEGENPLADVSYDAVKILTIHKAKGLEFPIVFLPNMSAGLNRSPIKPTLLSDWRTGQMGLRLVKAGKINTAMFLLEEETARREEAEEIRVFFVAATRAKNKMILLRSHTRDTGRFASYLKTAQMCPQPHAPSMALNNTNLPVTTLVWDKKNPFHFSTSSNPLPKTWDPQKLAARFLIRENHYTQLLQKTAVRTPSHLLREQEKPFYRERETTEAPSSNAITIGHLCHKVLEEWDFVPTQKTPDSQIKTALERAARIFELLPQQAEYEPTLQEAHDILSTFFSSDDYNRLCRAKIWGREIPFCYELDSTDEGPTLMRGVIDLLYEENGQLIVADFKTNKIPEGGISSLVQTYQPQGEAYQKAVQSSLKQPALFELIFLRGPFSTRL